jgi:ComF family protein
MIKLFRYRPAHPELATQRMIYALKHRRNSLCCQLLATDLSAAVLRETKGQQEEYIITYPPRSKKAIRENGFGHTEMLAKELGKATGIPVISALRRTGGSVQKKLSRTERMKNALAAFAPQKDLSLKGKRVLLLDDVVTTGATIAAAARHLRRMGAREVVTVAAAVTLREVF